MRILTYLIILAVVILGITFAVINSEKVTVNYYLSTSTLPLSLLLVITFTLGSILGLFVGFCLLIKAKIKIYRLKQRLTLAEKEIENLRAIPLQDNV